MLHRVTGEFNSRGELLRIPSAWLIQGANLKRAADLVGSRFQSEAGDWLKIADESDAGFWEHQMQAFELALPAFMLIGYAIEVLLKGLIVVRNGSTEAIAWMTSTHVSGELASRAQVDLNGQERQLVEQQLYHAVRWSGRYPAPKGTAAKLFVEQIERAKGSPFLDPRTVSTDHYRQACELFDRLDQELREEIAMQRRSRLKG